MANHKTEMAREFDPWKYAEKKDLNSLKNNKYIFPKSEEPEPVQKPLIESIESPSRIVSKDDYLVLEDLVCTDADGNVFERYDKLYVRKDIEKNNGSQIRFTPYNAIAHFESRNHFLPSFALSCNILASLYRNRSDVETNKVLMQYKDNGNGNGWHAQNTLVDWNGSKGTIIHYSNDKDFTLNGGSNSVNQNLRKSLDFKVKNFGNMELNEALKNKHFKNYLKNLTGLQKPEVLIDIGNYFSKPAYVWVPHNVGNVETTRASWLGCGSSSFGLGAGRDLGGDIAARGVLFSEPR